MCGGSCSTPRAPSLGGALVVLRPPPQSTTSITTIIPQKNSQKHHHHPIPHSSLPPSPPPSPDREMATFDDSDLEEKDKNSQVGQQRRQVEEEEEEEEEAPPPARSPPFSGSLIFHPAIANSTTTDAAGMAPQSKDHFAANMATHVTFTPDTTATTTTEQRPSTDININANTKSPPQPTTTSTKEYIIRIHTSGNLLEPAHTSPILHTLSLSSLFRPQTPAAPSSQTQPITTTATTPLPEPLEVGVGGQGIIGRRVTIWEHHHHHHLLPSQHYPLHSPSRRQRESHLTLVAEGVLGFN